MQNFRHVHQSDRFRQHFEELQPDALVALEFIKAAQRILRVRPEDGTKITTDEGDEIWILSMVEIFYQPSVLIFYEFDQYNVWLLDVVRSELDDFEF